MNRKIAFISAGVGVVAVAAVAATSLSLSPDLGLHAAEASAASAMFGATPAGWGHGWRGKHGRGMARLCGEDRGEHLDHMISFVENFMSFTPPQRAAWDDLATALRTGSERVGTACGELKGFDRPHGATEKPALAETLLRTGLDVVVEVRPAFDAFYGTLDDKQKKALDELTSHRRGRWH